MKYLSICIILLVLLSASGCINDTPVTKTPTESSSIVPAPAPAPNNMVSSPIDPDFLKYQEELKAGKIVMQTKKGNYLGAIPDIIDESHFAGMTVADEDTIHKLQSGEYPVYDLRGNNKLTSIKHQGQCGSCWAFATFGSMESILLANENMDFSENNLKNTHGFSRGHSDGGNKYMSTAYLTRWSGPIFESQDTYNENSSISPSGLNPVKHVYTVHFIPGRINATDFYNIKWALMNYGAIQTSMLYADSSYNAANSSYYYNGTGNTNHAVDIVGWNDSYSKFNFNNVPPGDGAFIIRNSWGTDWGDDGYFYISYYDNKIGYSNAIYFTRPVNAMEKVYSYDPYGKVNDIGFTNLDNAWFANVFTSTDYEDLYAAGFYTNTVNCKYDLFVYKGLPSNNVTSGQMVYNQSGIINVPGYHTITFNKNIKLIPGDRFSIVINMTSPGYNYPIPIELKYSGYSGNASSISGQSYASKDGKNWTDIKNFDYYGTTNVCLKAYTNVADLTPNAVAISNNIPSTMAAGGKYYVSVTMKNTGTLPWSESQLIRLAVSGDNNADAAKFSPLRMNINNGVRVDPGQSYTWNFWMTAPAAGTYNLKYRMIHDGVEYFGATVSKTVTVSQPVYDADILSDNLPSMIAKNESFNITIKIKNTGNTPWVSNEGIKLYSIGADASRFGPSGIMYPGLLITNPGETYSWNLSLKAPSTTGQYTLKYTMMNNTTVFGETLTKVINVDSLDLRSDVISNTIPSSMVKDRTANAYIIMKNTGNTQWSASNGFSLKAIENETNYASSMIGKEFTLPQGVTIMPGEQYKWEFTVNSYKNPGTYPVKFRMYQQRYGWFGDNATRTITIKAAIAI